MDIQQLLNDWWFFFIPLCPALLLFYLPLFARVVTLASAAIAVTGLLAFFAWRSKRNPVVALPDGTMVDVESRKPEASSAA